MDGDYRLAPPEGIIFTPVDRISHVQREFEPLLGGHPNRKRTTRVLVRPWWPLLALLLSVPVAAQVPSLSNKRSTPLVLDRDTVAIDTLSVAPGSFRLMQDGLPVDTSLYDVLPYQALLLWKGAQGPDTLWAEYRVLPLWLGGTFAHKDRTRLLSPSGDRVDPFKYVPPTQVADPFASSGLNKNGSISRGVLFGNNQDLSVNSTLNLELSGRITDRINVLASVTDNNIPIQAGGNTQELQDFDQVFIKLFEEPSAPGATGWELIAGDLVLQRPKSHFLTYLKKSRGLSFATTFPLAEGVTNDLGTSVAISKGKFARNQIQGVEGVQGPYRLSGNEGGTFIIILSGTERVYFNGELLTRGQENDYVIDYNTAELTFTANRLITKDRRIIVEFQYSDKNYVRSLVRLEDRVALSKDTELRLNVYSEQDHKNQSLQQTLTDEERLVLSEAGDDPLAAAVPGVDSLAFDPDQVLYRRTDSLGYSPVYVYSTVDTLAHFRLSFTNVGSGNGDYVQQEFTPNGRVFRWVAPDTVNGALVRKGDHAPVRVLIAPTSQQMITLAADHRFSARTKATVELAYSRRDLNTFSTQDASDDAGGAILTRMEHTIPLGGADTTLALVLDGDLESVTRDFNFVERYRAVEFERNWNTLGVDQKGDQVVAGGGIGLKGRKVGRSRYGLSTYQVRDRYAGVKHDLQADLHPGRFDLVGTASLLNTTKPFSSTFLRHLGRVARRSKGFTVGFLSEHELNRYRADTSDALLAGSYEFHEWEVYIQAPDTFKNKWRLFAGQRFDDGLRDGGLARATLAHSYGTTFSLARDPRNRLATTFTYRRLEIQDTTLTAQRPEDTYLARVDYDVTALKGVATWDLFYEFGSGLEQRREFIYLQVPAGQGIYVWIDYNGNGIKDLNEFEVAAFGYEADHIRVFVPSNTYVRTFSNQFSTAMDLRPAVAWGDRKGLAGFISKFSDLASFRIDRKTGEGTALLEAMDPFSLQQRDSALIAYSSSIRNTVYYDRTSRKWSVDHTFQSDQNKTLLLNGFESRDRRSDQVRMRWNATRQWTADVEGQTGRITNLSDLLVGRNYSIGVNSLKPRLTWQAGTTFRAAMSYKVTEKQNDDELGGEASLANDLGLEVRYNSPGKGSVQMTANLVDIAFDGDVNSSLGNEMLEGLKPGTNVTWGITVQRNLSNHLQIDLTYTGRRSEAVPAIHVGGVQVRAYF